MSEDTGLDLLATLPPDDGESLDLGLYAQRAYLEYALSVVKGRACLRQTRGAEPHLNQRIE